MIFYIVDVFAEKRYTGNQLAVCRVDRDLTQEEMQDIAREMHFSETTFIFSDTPKDGGYPVRIFTPEAELPFAGHPTLGTAFVIQKEIIRQPVEKITLNLKVGQIPVTFGDADGDREILWMQQKEPEFGQTFESSKLAKVLGLDEPDIDSTFPVEAVSTGLPHIIVPVRGLTALKKASLSRRHYDDLVSDTDIKAVMTFCGEGYHEHHDLSVRMFAPALGVLEDPATGSGNGCLAAYVVKHRYLGSEQINIKTAQGYEINRPSLLFLNASRESGRFDIRVGGKVIKIAQGELV